MRRQRFVGRIAGVGTASGTRVVVGRWHDTPMGAFADAMVETPSGHRVLLAPRPDVAEFIAATYSFDEVRIEDFTIADAGDGSGWRVRSPSLALDLEVGAPTALGRLLSVVPHRLATAPAWCALTDPVARVVLRGVRTRGSAGGGRREYYGATGVRRSGRRHRHLGGRRPGYPRPGRPAPALRLLLHPAPPVGHRRGDDGRGLSGTPDVS